MTDQGAIRVLIQQPVLPKYRIPVFRELAKRPGINLEVVYGDHSTAPANVPADGFRARLVSLKLIQVGRATIMWHRPQWRGASKNRTDVLILSWDLHYLSLLPALLRAKWNNVATILWGHGYSKREAGWRRFLRERIAKLGTAVMFYNHGTAEAYKAAGWDPQRVHVALNALDQAPIREAREAWLGRQERLTEFKKKHGLDQGPVALFVSRLEHDNRVDLLLQAAVRIRERFPTFKVVIVGKGPILAELQELTARLNLQSAVIFTGAIYGEEDIAPWFLSASVFCYPANIGLSILHAFGYGLPVITSDSIEAQNPEIEALVHEKNGLLYAHGDVDALADAILKVISNPDLQRRLSENALETVTSRFTLENMVDGMAGAIEYCAKQLGPSNNRILRHVPDTSTASPNGRPAAHGRLAIVANSITPYRVHVHRRIARELPQLELFSVFTHMKGSANWKLDAPADIQPVVFGPGESAEQQDQLVYAWHEWRKAGRIIDWMRDNLITLVIVPGYNDVGRIRIIRWCHRNKIPVYLWADSNVHGDLARGTKRALKEFVVRRTVRWCDAILPFGSLGQEYFRHYGASEEKMFLVPLEPDYSALSRPSDERIAQVTEKFGLRSGRRRIVFSGRLVREKRVDLLIDAFCACAAERPNWDLVLAGDGPLRASLQAAVRPELKDRVTWAGFVSDSQDLFALYHSCDVLVLPSDYEPWGLVLNEGAAAGLAIVASDVCGGAPELVVDGLNGRIFEHGNVEALKAALLTVTADDVLESMKKASLAILSDWRTRGDPITGLRAALSASGTLAFENL